MFQVGIWLRYGEWLDLPLALTWHRLGFPFPEAEWGGIEKILVWIFEQSTSVILLVAGVALLGAGAKLLPPR